MDHVNTVAADLSAPANPTVAGKAGTKSSTDARKPVRRDPEKRRQQNIQAQKKYREKLRTKLSNLEALAASVARGRESAPVTIPRPILPAVTTMAQACTPSAPLERSCLVLDQIPGTFDSGSSSTGVTPPSDAELNPVPNGEAPVWDITNWDPTTSVDPSHLIPDKYRDTMLTCWVTDYVDCGCPLRHVQIRLPKETGEKRYQIVSIEPSCFPADPYLNSLRIERMCYVDAMWSNCLHLGINLEAFCGDDAISQFCRRTQKPSDDGDNDSMVLTVQSIFKTLKPDLRPVREQITVIHPPYIDVLPFPTLRRNIIRNLDKVPEQEMFQDMLDGLVCWGGAGIGKADRECSTGRTTTGAPWDGRSWEAKPWFIRKHWELLGGDDGELVRQSEWWRNMRGELLDPLLAC